jgi:halimadienyl-diphosphate synthase
VSTNAHALEAFGRYATVHLAAPYAATTNQVAVWLNGQQHPDGYWRDRWHASAYYATCCAALALDAFGGRQAQPYVTRATRWVLDTQRADGSWGQWAGTAEETAYAVQILLLTAAAGSQRARQAACKGGDYLLAVGHDAPPLWHDKDLYLPAAVVRAAVLAALHLVQVRAGGLDRVVPPPSSPPGSEPLPPVRQPTHSGRSSSISSTEASRL